MAARRAGLTDSDLDLLTDQQVMTIIAINHYQMTPKGTQSDEEQTSDADRGEAAFFNL